MSYLITPILCDSVTRTVTTKEAFALELFDKKLIATTIKTLSPLSDELNHCKRVKNNDERILCLINIEDSEKFSKDDIVAVEIPEYKVCVRKQFEDSKLYWPVHFHPDQRLEKLLARETPEIWSRPEYHGKYIFEEKEAAIIVDPSSGNIIATDSGSDKLHPLAHPIMNAINDLSNKKSEYLATGFDIYLKREPCAMCSMALVHMRIKRIFFMEDNPKQGSLKTKLKLHTIQGINHNFQVYQISQDNH
ncbi:probable inactive tRNA-specific adenosine deaminase-like protein 3 [Lepeophtheirus salmonis]|uniref:probable inactive tRNA-specific adenosine deaminase-like protein 3 n=1 Tax=Lepeophtheirus salmonis TaxID=72036 RepID=UPI001AE9C788|nr:probable inactive tRNA-specific adenosine deaminase-like protein 3 [Lepeophtheirus salmonis]